MSGPFRNTIRIVDPVCESGPGSKLNLSIELLPDGFVFSLLDAEAFRYIALEAYRQEHNGHISHYLKHLGGFMQENSLLNRSFDRISVSCYSPQLVIVPNDLYRQDDQEAAYGFCASLQPRCHVRSDILNNMQSRAIYAVPDQVISFCEEHMPGYRLRHHGSVLIESVMAVQAIENWQADMVLHVKPRHFDVMILEKNKLNYFQSFEIQCFDDLLYYLFYVLEQHEMPAAKLRLMLLGELAMDSEHYALLQSFFGEVRFPERNDMFQYSEDFEKVPYHFFFNLLNLDTCG